MNKKLKVALIRRASEQGFALPIALGLGFVMLLIAATMIMRSQGDQVTASAQKNTAQSLAVNEGGVTRSISILNQPNNAFLLKLNYDPINPDTGETYLGPDGIPNSSDEETTAVNQWSSPPNSIPCSSSISAPSELVSETTIGSGSYEVKAYRYRDPDGIPNNGDEIGTLLVEGQQGNAVSQVQVSMRIVQRPLDGSFAGLYASNLIDLGNNDVISVTGGSGAAANVICRDCTVDADQCVGGVPTQEGLEDAVAMGPNSQVDGNIMIGDPQLPPVPTPPASGAINLGSVGGGNNLLPLELPRAGDSPSSGAYHYIINDLDIGSNVITVDTTDYPVYLYVSGDVTLNGQGGISHSGSSERLRLYGNPADADDTNDQSITISGGSSPTKMFIYAPDANMGINGGSSSPDIEGAVWVKTWDESNSNNAEIVVPDNMPTLLGGNFGSVGIQTYGSSTPNSWQRQPVSTE
jgi:hypothetical protein